MILGPAETDSYLLASLDRRRREPKRPVSHSTRLLLITKLLGTWLCQCLLLLLLWGLMESGGDQRQENNNWTRWNGSVSGQRSLRGLWCDWNNWFVSQIGILLISSNHWIGTGFPVERYKSGMRLLPFGRQSNLEESLLFSGEVKEIPSTPRRVCLYYKWRRW